MGLETRTCIEGSLQFAQQTDMIQVQPFQPTHPDPLLDAPCTCRPSTTARPPPQPARPPPAGPVPPAPRPRPPSARQPATPRRCPCRSPRGAPGNGCSYVVVECGVGFGVSQSVSSLGCRSQAIDSVTPNGTYLDDDPARCWWGGCCGSKKPSAGTAASSSAARRGTRTDRGIVAGGVVRREAVRGGGGGSEGFSSQPAAEAPIGPCFGKSG